MKGNILCQAFALSGSILGVCTIPPPPLPSPPLASSRTCPSRNISLMKGLELENVLLHCSASPPLSETESPNEIHISSLSLLSLAFGTALLLLSSHADGVPYDARRRRRRQSGSGSSGLTSKLGILKIARVVQHERVLQLLILTQSLIKG